MTYQRRECKLVEIYRTEYGSVYQCNKNNKFILEFYGDPISFSPRHFLDFVRIANQIDLKEMAGSTARHADTVIIMPPYSGRFYILTISAVLQLRDLLNGAKAMIQLNSIINECLLPYAF